jgi:hypothetical protein
MEIMGFSNGIENRTSLIYEFKTLLSLCAIKIMCTLVVQIDMVSGFNSTWRIYLAVMSV